MNDLHSLFDTVGFAKYPIRIPQEHIIPLTLYLDIAGLFKPT